MGKRNDQRETEDERAIMDVARQQIGDFDVRWRPQQRRLAQGVVDANAPGSFERRRAATMAKADTGAAFAGANQRLNTGAAASGEFGGSKHKLALVGMGNDQATSSGMSTVAADQAGDSNYVTGLKAVTALGRGEKATALGGMERSARIGAFQAQADAQRSFENRAGNAQLAGQLAGVGAGLYMGREPQKPTYFEQASADGTLPDQMPNESRRLGLRYAGGG